jgi:hypothetical protein
MNTIRSKRHNGFYLFIDFKKAFDLVDSRLLIAKLKHYGFDESSLRLISGYFSDRKQYVKFNGATSTASDIKLGVVQGSCLGPLLFNIFINDLPYFLNELITRMFADDTTVSASDTDYTKLLVKFNKSIEPLLIWCRFNKTDINWLKTEIMFISKKMALNEKGKCRLLVFPEFINISGHNVKVVGCFRLLGIPIDRKLNFHQYASELRKSINKKLYSIKKLFYLSFQVKLQFFKTFILPYFDYCSTLIIYFIKTIIQKIANYYYYCLSRLLNFKCTFSLVDSFDFNNINN